MGPIAPHCNAITDYRNMFKVGRKTISAQFPTWGEEACLNDSINLQGLEGYSRDQRWDRNTVQDSEKTQNGSTGYGIWLLPGKRNNISTSTPRIYSNVPFFFLLLLEVSQAHQELVLVSPVQPHQILFVLKVLVTILGISAYYRRKELDWSITATKDLRWYSVTTTKDNKNKAMDKTWTLDFLLVGLIQVTFFLPQE